mgnify:CR=1 FL=1
MLIVFGGTFFAVMYRCELPQFLGSFGVMGKVFMPGKRSVEDLISRVSELATIARKDGMMALEGQEVPDKFFEKGLQMLVDGADEVDPKLVMIKGGGGALLQEKIVAESSERMIVIVDEGKIVDKLGKFPLPVEVIKFGSDFTRKRIISELEKLGYSEISASAAAFLIASSISPSSSIMSI